MTTDPRTEFRRRIREARREPEYSQMRARTQMRRLITIAGKATGVYETTVGEVAQAMRITPAEVVDLLRDQWLLIMEEGASTPMACWLLSEDGE